MHKPGTGVVKLGLRLPGTITQCAPANKYVPQPWYMVEWVDGTTSEEPECHLQVILPPSEPGLILLLA